MKKIYSFIPALIFSAGITIIISQKSILNISREDKNENTPGYNADDGRMQYELQRLRDPATGKIPDNIRHQELEYAATLPGFISSVGREMQLDSSNNLTWQSRGPWNVGGRTRAFAMDIANSNKFLVGSTSGGMWMSANAGISWNQTWGIPNQSISCISQDTRTGKTNTWYVGTGEGYGQSAGAIGAYYLGNGMYKSIDGGQTWNSLTVTAANAPQTFNTVWDIIWNIATNPADTANDVVYVATYGAIMKSINGGTSYTVVCGSSSSGPYSYFSDVTVTPSGVIYATLSSDGSFKGIYRSPDGTTWTNITPVNFPTTYGRIKIGFAPSDENQVYFFAGTTTGFGSPYINSQGQIVEWNSLWKYHYNTLGGKWYNLSANLPTTGTQFDKQYTQGCYDMVVKVHPTDTAIVFLGGTDLYRSTSGFFTSGSTIFIGGYQHGATLPVVNIYLNHHPDQHEIVFMPSSPNTMISTNDGGIYKTTNNLASTVAWTPLNNGYLNSMFYTVALDHASSNDSTVIGGTQDNGSWFENSKNVSTTWVQPDGGDGAYCAIANNKLNYYFSSEYARIIKATLNSSGSVQTFRRIDPIGGKKYLFVNPFLLDPNNNNVMYLAGGKNLWRNDSLNIIPMNGKWDSISTGWIKFPDTVPTAGATITALAISKNPANILFYGTSSKNIYRINNANTGTPSAVDITGSAFPNGANVSCIAVDPLDARKMMVAFSNYNVYSIFYTSNGDSTVPTWIKVAGNLEQNSNSTGSGTGPSVRWVSIMPDSGGTVYFAATSTGLYATDTLMGTSTLWAQQAASTIGNSICDMVDFRTSDGLVAVATHSHGIFTTNITNKNNVLSVHNLSNPSFQLSNFPNPFSNSTTISFTLSKNAKVKLNIYDMNGRIIQTLADKEFSSGENRLLFAGENLSTGIYYCVMRTGEAVETKKMIIIK